MSFTTSAPFTDEQQKSINTYQRDGRWPILYCGCGGRQYGRSDGLVCNSCFRVDPDCPTFVTNWTWSKFKNSKEQVDGDIESSRD